MDLPRDLHTSMASDRARLVRTPSDVVPPPVSVRSMNGMNGAPHARVQSQHGVIIEHAAHVDYVPGLAISEEPEVLSTAELAAALDNEEEDLGTHSGVMHDGGWYEERSPTSERSFSQVQGQGQVPSYQVQAQDPRFAHSGNAQSAALTPPPRSSSRSGSLGAPRGHQGAPPSILIPSSDSQYQQQQQDQYSQNQLQPQQFADKPRYALSDSGPISTPSSPVHPGIRRAVSDTYVQPHSQSEPNSPNSPSATGMGSGTLTPPMRRGGAKSASGLSPKYATFEEMGIQGKGMAQAQAEKDAKDCVIM